MFFGYDIRRLPLLAGTTTFVAADTNIHVMWEPKAGMGEISSRYVSVAPTLALPRAFGRKGGNADPGTARTDEQRMVRTY